MGGKPVDGCHECVLAAVSTVHATNSPLWPLAVATDRSCTMAAAVRALATHEPLCEDLAVLGDACTVYCTNCTQCEVAAFRRTCNMRAILHSRACQHPIVECGCGLPVLHGKACEAPPGSQCIDLARRKHSAAACPLFQGASPWHVQLRKWPRDTPYPEERLQFVRASCEYVLPSVSPGQLYAPCGRMFGRSATRGRNE